VFISDKPLNRGKLIVLLQDRRTTDTKSTGEEGCLDTPGIENIGTRRSHKAALLLEMRYVGSRGAVTTEKGGGGVGPVQDGGDDQKQSIRYLFADMLLFYFVLTIV